MAVDGRPRLFDQRSAGDTVEYQGRTYAARWWTSNQTPGDPKGPRTEVAKAPDGTARWTPSGSYRAGGMVEYQGEKYVAQWWNRDDTPDTPNGPWKATG